MTLRIGDDTPAFELFLNPSNLIHMISNGSLYS